MKKILCIAFMMLFVFVSCSEDNDTTNDGKIIDETIVANPMPPYIPLATAGRNLPENLLGYGYDFTRKITGAELIKAPVLDIDAYEKAGNSVLAFDATESGARHAYGENIEEYLQSLAQMFYQRIDLGLDRLGIPNFTKTMLDENFLGKDFRKYTYISEHDVMAQRLFSLQELADDERTRERLRPFFTAEFSSDMLSMSGQNLVDKYGTHLLCGYNSGARIDKFFKAKLSAPKYINKGDTVIGYLNYESVISGGLSHVKKRTNTDIYSIIGDSIYCKTMFSESANPVFHIELYGALKGLIPDGTYNLEKGFPNALPVDWTSVFGDNNPKMDLITVDYLLPIFALFEDLSRRKEIEEAVKQHVLSKQF